MRSAFGVNALPRRRIQRLLPGCPGDHAERRCHSTHDGSWEVQTAPGVDSPYAGAGPMRYGSVWQTARVAWAAAPGR
jgi:hypothetical protein